MINKEEQSHQMISALFSLSTAYFVFRIHTGLKMEEIFLRFFSNQPFNQLPIIGQMHHHCGFCPYGIMLCNGISNSPVCAYGFIGKLLMGYIYEHQDGSVNNGHQLFYHYIAGAFRHAGVKSNILVNITFSVIDSFLYLPAQEIKLFTSSGEA